MKDIRVDMTSAKSGGKQEEVNEKMREILKICLKSIILSLHQIESFFVFKDRIQIFTRIYIFHKPGKN